MEKRVAGNVPVKEFCPKSSVSKLYNSSSPSSTEPVKLLLLRLSNSVLVGKAIQWRNILRSEQYQVGFYNG
jgi:hypothetical protein